LVRAEPNAGLERHRTSGLYVASVKACRLHTTAPSRSRAQRDDGRMGRWIETSFGGSLRPCCTLTTKRYERFVPRTGESRPRITRLATSSRLMTKRFRQPLVQTTRRWISWRDSKTAARRRARNNEKTEQETTRNAMPRWSRPTLVK